MVPDLPLVINALTILNANCDIPEIEVLQLESVHAFRAGTETSYRAGVSVLPFRPGKRGTGQERFQHIVTSPWLSTYFV